METKTQRIDMWTWGGGKKKRVGYMERVKWKHVYYHM